MKYIINTIFILLILTSCEQEQKKQTGLPDPLEAGWKGKSVCKVLQENDKLRVLKCTFPPGVGHEKHEHQPHFGYTLAGSKFRMTDAEGIRELDIPTGYSFIKDFVSAHEAVNIGDSTAVFLIVEYK
jgi:quercetin dioxygenase-like cupin family protein